jgi:hypothetical protein
MSDSKKQYRLARTELEAKLKEMAAWMSAFDAIARASSDLCDVGPHTDPPMDGSTLVAFQQAQYVFEEGPYPSVCEFIKAANELIDGES